MLLRSATVRSSMRATVVTATTCGVLRRAWIGSTHVREHAASARDAGPAARLRRRPPAHGCERADPVQAVEQREPLRPAARRARGHHRGRDAAEPLPRPRVDRARRRARRRGYDVPHDHLALGTGSVGLLQQVVQISAGPGDEVLFAWRSFEAYPIMTIIAGATPGAGAAARRREPRPRRDGRRHHRPHPARLRVHARTTPRARSCARTSSTASSTGCPTTSWSIVDEAYVEFVRDPAAVRGIDTYRDRPNVAVLRTFSKAYGLAGLRVGFADRAPAGRARAAPDAGAVRRLDRRAGRGARVARAPSRPCSRGSTCSSPSAPGSRAASPRRAGGCRRARPTSSGCASATASPSSCRPARR